MRETTDNKKEAKKNSLLQAALKLFLNKGVSKTSISEIAEQANVAKGTFYLYFKDKDALLEQLLYQLSYHIIQQAHNYTQQHRSELFCENVITFADWIITYFTEHTDILRLIRRNFTWPALESTLHSANTADPLWKAITTSLNNASLRDVHNPQELFNMLYIIVELCGTVCYTSIIEQQPDTIDHMKPLLYTMIRRILQ